MQRGRGAGEERTQGAAVDHGRGTALHRGRAGRGAEVEAGGHEIGEEAVLMTHGTALRRGNTPGPVHDERRQDPALVGEVFILAEGRVGGVGPSAAVVATALAVVAEIGELELAQGRAFGFGAVVREEKDRGVFELAAFAEVGDEAAEVLVNAVDHRGVGGHDRIHAVLVLGREAFPGRDFAALGAEPVGGSGARAEGGGGRDQAEFLLALQRARAEDIPALLEAAAVFGEVFRHGLHGEVRGVVGEIEKERGVGFAGRVIAEVGDGLGGERVGGVVALTVRRNLFVAAMEIVRAKKIRGAFEETVETVEAALEGPSGRVAIADVPLAGHVGAVAGRAEHLGQRGHRRAHPAAVGDGHFHAFGELRGTRAGALEGHVTEAGLMRMESGDERGATGAAAGVVVELGEAHAVGRQAVEDGSFDGPTVAAEVGPAHVVDQDDDHVGPAFGGEGGDGEKKEEDGEPASRRKHGEEATSVQKRLVRSRTNWRPRMLAVPAA